MSKRCKTMADAKEISDAPTTDLQALEASDAAAAHLLSILHEIRSTVGPSALLADASQSKI